MSYNGLTNQGLEYLTRCQVESKPVVFSKVKIGNGNIPMGSTGETTTDLYSFKKEIEILNKEQVENSIKMEILINNFDVLEEFYVKEIGVYVMDNDVEKLYWYINKDRPSPLPDKNTPAKHRYILHLETSQTESIILNYSGLDLMVDKEFVEKKIKEKVRTFEIPTIAELQSRKNLKVGDIVEVLGYYTAGDGAGHKRIIANEDDRSGVQLANGLWANIVHSGIIKVSWFGAKGDGVTDDSGAIQKAINYLPASDWVLVFEPKVYIQGDGTNPSYTNSGGKYSGDPNIGKFIGFDFFKKSNFIIRGNGAVIKAHPNNSCINNNRGFRFDFCTDFTIENLNYDGQITSRKPWGGDGGLYNNQSGIVVAGCRRGVLRDVTSNYCVMDGIIVAGHAVEGTEYTYTEDILLKNCEAKYNYRQGLTGVNAHKVTCIKCNFSYNGTIYGTSPMAGVDFEQGYSGYEDVGQKRSVFYNCLFEYNKGSNIALHWGTYNSIIDSCTFKGSLENNFSGVFIPQDSDALTCNNTIQNCYFENSKVDSSAGGLYLINNIFKFIPVQNMKKGLGLYIADLNKNYQKGLSRRTVVKGNHFYYDLKNIDVTQKEIITASQNFFTAVGMNLTENTFINLYNIVENNKPGYSVGTHGSLAEDSIIKNNIFSYSDTRVTEPVCLIDLSLSANVLENTISEFINLAPFRPRNLTTKSTGRFYFDKGKPIWWDGTKWVDATGGSAVAQLNTPYMATKMQQEGVYNDFITYMDEKTLYNKQQRKLEEQRQLAYEQALQENPELTYEEFLSMQPMTLNLSVVEEPQPSPALQEFMNKYL